MITDTIPFVCLGIVTDSIDQGYQVSKKSYPHYTITSTE